MKKALHVILTILFMLAVSRMAVRIVDATVQIDDDLWVLIAFLILINCLIGLLSRNLYIMSQKTKYGGNSHGK